MILGGRIIGDGAMLGYWGVLLFSLFAQVAGRHGGTCRSVGTWIGSLIFRTLAPRTTAAATYGDNCEQHAATQPMRENLHLHHDLYERDV